MPIAPNTAGIKEAVGEYDFAVDGGAVSTIVLRGGIADNNIPNGAIVLGGVLEVDTVPTSGGAATIGVNSQAAADLSAAVLISGAPWSTVGRKSVIPVFTGATSVKTTAPRNIAITIGTAALTAGKFRVRVLYI